MRFLILGADGPGGYFGGMLLTGGADVAFLCVLGGRLDSLLAGSSSRTWRRSHGIM
jgi:hypothetical protein